MAYKLAGKFWQILFIDEKMEVAKGRDPGGRQKKRTVKATQGPYRGHIQKV